MNLKGILPSLFAWFVFTFTAHYFGVQAVGWAALAALVVALVIFIKNMPKGVKLLDLTGVITFAALTLAAFLGGEAVRQLVVDFGRAGCAFVLGIVMAVSVFTVPFTEQYARETVPPKVWDSPRFKSVNRKISGIWAVVILAMAVGHLVDGFLSSADPSGNGPVVPDLLFNWVLPIGLSVIAVVLTKRTVAAARPAAEKASGA